MRLDSMAILASYHIYRAQQGASTIFTNPLIFANLNFRLSFFLAFNITFILFF